MDSTLFKTELFNNKDAYNKNILSRQLLKNALLFFTLLYKNKFIVNNSFSLSIKNYKIINFLWINNKIGFCSCDLFEDKRINFEFVPNKKVFMHQFSKKFKLSKRLKTDMKYFLGVIINEYN